jgi:hypothetical protein
MNILKKRQNAGRDVGLYVTVDQHVAVSSRSDSGYNLINFLMRTKHTHKVQPKSHTCFGSEVKSINLSTQNKNAKQNFQRTGFCSEFYSRHDRRDMNEIRGGRRVRKSFLKDGVDTRTKKKRKCL